LGDKNTIREDTVAHVEFEPSYGTLMLKESKGARDKNETKPVSIIDISDRTRKS